MHDLASALAKEARLAGEMPTIIQLLIDQQKWIRKNLSEGHVPGALHNCHCGVCENALEGYRLLRRFENVDLAGQGSTLNP